MYIVRKQDHYHGRGGASYLVEAVKSRYRWGKTTRDSARVFASKKSARMWAERYNGNVVPVL